jgi:hypothetical protein
MKKETFDKWNPRVVVFAIMLGISAIPAPIFAAVSEIRNGNGYTLLMMLIPVYLFGTVVFVGMYRMCRQAGLIGEVSPVVVKEHE